MIGGRAEEGLRMAEGVRVEAGVAEAAAGAAEVGAVEAGVVEVAAGAAEAGALEVGVAEAAAGAAEVGAVEAGVADAAAENVEPFDLDYDLWRDICMKPALQMRDLAGDLFWLLNTMGFQMLPEFDLRQPLGAELANNLIHRHAHGELQRRLNAMLDRALVARHNWLAMHHPDGIDLELGFEERLAQLPRAVLLGVLIQEMWALLVALPYNFFVNDYLGGVVAWQNLPQHGDARKSAKVLHVGMKFRLRDLAEGLEGLQAPIDPELGADNMQILKRGLRAFFHDHGWRDLTQGFVTHVFCDLEFISMPGWQDVPVRGSARRRIRVAEERARAASHPPEAYLDNPWEALGLPVGLQFHVDWLLGVPSAETNVRAVQVLLRGALVANEINFRLVNSSLNSVHALVDQADLRNELTERFLRFFERDNPLGGDPGIGGREIYRKRLITALRIIEFASWLNDGPRGDNEAKKRMLHLFGEGGGFFLESLNNIRNILMHAVEHCPGASAVFTDLVNLRRVLDVCVEVARCLLDGVHYLDYIAKRRDRPDPIPGGDVARMKGVLDVVRDHWCDFLIHIRAYRPKAFSALVHIQRLSQDCGPVCGDGPEVTDIKDSFMCLYGQALRAVANWLSHENCSYVFEHYRRRLSEVFHRFSQYRGIRVHFTITLRSLLQKLVLLLNTVPGPGGVGIDCVNLHLRRRDYFGEPINRFLVPYRPIQIEYREGGVDRVRIIDNEADLGGTHDHLGRRDEGEEWARDEGHPHHRNCLIQ